MINFFYRIYSFIFLRILKRKIIFNQQKFGSKCKAHALLYYKIDPFLNPITAKNYYHTNNREILEIVKILNRFGFITDIIDRSMNLTDLDKLKNHYDLFIGLGAGNSGKHFAAIAEKYPQAKKILYAAGPEPNLSNELVRKRYAYFEQRHPEQKLKIRRMITDFDFEDFAPLADAFIVVGNEFSINSYKAYQKPIYPIYPSSSPNIRFNSNIKADKQNKFLYFGGNGNIVKGLDLLIEVFYQLPDLELHICAPSDETDFYKQYQTVLQNSSNIFFHGFIKPAGKKFHELTEKCGYIILPSCSEGIATSVTTCMRSGLIPVVTYETGIDTGDFGFLLETIEIEKLINQVFTISKISLKEFQERTMKTYAESEKYTLNGFIQSFTDAIEKSTQANLNI